jgi:hypothetical protein
MTILSSPTILPSPRESRQCIEDISPVGEADIIIVGLQTGMMYIWTAAQLDDP